MKKYAILLFIILASLMAVLIAGKFDRITPQNKPTLKNNLTNNPIDDKLTGSVSQAKNSDHLLAVEKESGLVSIYQDSGDLAVFNLVGWDDGWQWDPPTLSKAQNESSKHLKFAQQEVNLTVTPTVVDYGMKYTLRLDYLKADDKTIGGAIDFLIGNLPKTLTQGGSAPVLLPNNRGWSWQFSETSKLQVEFEPALPNIHIDWGNRGQIRAWLFDKRLSVGSKTYTMKLRLPKHQYIEHNEFSQQKLAAVDASQGWSILPKSSLEPAIDLSHLNHKPAGKFGFVTTKGENFVFPNGEATRFFGVNIQAYSLFIKDQEKIKAHAKRLAKLGVNLVRLHHHDSATWVSPSLIKDGDTTQEINRNSLDSYHWWIKCLKDEGIYVWIDLQVDRPWRKGDAIPGWNTDFKSYNDVATSKGVIYLNRRMINLSKKFNEDLLLTTNPYTGLKLVDEPAVMSVTITNENDLTTHFGHLLNNKEQSPFHLPIFRDRMAQFGKRTPFFQWQLKQTWKPGPSKLLLNDIEAKFNLEMIAHLRSIGLKVPISTTNLWSEASSLYSIPALSTGDLIDAHGYAGGNPLKTNPTTEPGLISWLAYGQVKGKPYTVSEFNSDESSTENSAHQILPFISAHASLQDWDAIILYGYSQDGFSARNFSSWSSYLNPSVMDMLPASALLYREKHVATSVSPKVLGDLEKRIFYQDISPKTSSTIRTLSEQSQLKIALPANQHLAWLRPSQNLPKAELIQKLDYDFLTKHSSSVSSDTGELDRNWESGEFIINTPKSQGSINTRPNTRINLDNVSYQIAQKGANIVFSSFENKLELSEKILLTIASEVRSRKNGSSIDVLTQQIKGQFEFKSKIANLTIKPLNSTSAEDIQISSAQLDSDYLYTFELLPNNTATLYLIYKESSE